MKKYTCKDCNFNFEGDDFTEICPNCSSSSIIPTDGTGGGVFEFVNKIPKSVLYAFGVIIFLILLMNMCGDDSIKNTPTDANLKYEVRISDFDQEDKSISINIFQIGEDKVRVKKNDLIRYFNFKVINTDGENEFKPSISGAGTKSTAKIYPCVSGSLEISWSPSKSYKLISPQKRKSFPLIEFDAPNTNASCKLSQLVFVSIDDSNKGDGCFKKIKLNYSKDVWISVNGKDGKYSKDKFEFNFRNFDTYDLWAFHRYPGQSKIDTIPYQDNTTKIIKGDNCISCSDKKGKLLDKFIQTMKDWLINPKDKTLRNKVLSLTHRAKSTFYLDNKAYDFEGLYDHIRGNYEDEKYKLETSSIKFNNNICKVKSFKVKIVN